MIRFRRVVQLVCLSLFLFLLTLVSVSGISPLFPEIFLQLDPALMAVSAIGARAFLTGLIPAGIVLLSAPLIGRIFCGYVCPMGTTLDGTDRIFAPRKKAYFFSKTLFRAKYLVLVFLLGAALFGVSFVFLASPLSLITRAYGLVIFPVVSFLSRESLDLIRPVGDLLDMNSIIFAQIRTIRFDTQFFIFFFFVIVAGMVFFAPRFWCRYLCPSGALFALVSKSPFIRRQVSDGCTQCGKCTRQCPMSAIERQTPENTFHSECIVCRTCQEVCPEQVVSFGRSEKASDPVSERFSPERRHLVSTGLIGAGTAVMTLTGLTSLHGKPGDGQVGTPGLVRPPGTLPETRFLARCVRCGECMAACPTNTLQPIWLKAGFPALFSPAVTPRRGFCDPQCLECGRVCPTGAIRHLDASDRIWAKVGTATINRQTCLAWEFQKSCMVCDEVCPYDAVEFVKEENTAVPVPHVLENKCAGCGYCEHFCPVQNRAAIVITPMDALRFSRGSYEHEARLKGFDLRLKPQGHHPLSPEIYPESQPGSAPGFDAAPGFDPE